MKLKRVFLWGLLISLAVAAGLAIVALLIGWDEETIGRAILTMLAVGAFFGLSLACMDAAEKGSWGPAMLSAGTVAAIALVWSLLMIWVLPQVFTAPGGYYDPPQWIWKVQGLLVIWAFALPLIGHLSILRLTDATRWLRPLAIVLAMLSGLSLTAPIVLEIEAEMYYRLMGVLLVVTLLTAVVVRVMQRMQGLDRQVNIETTKLEVELKCPRCLHRQTVTAGHSRCAHCKLRFNIEIEEPRCPKCNYLLFNLVHPQCPECGTALSQDDAVSSTIPAPSAPAAR
jgi:hypothetical protein